MLYQSRWATPTVFSPWLTRPGSISVGLHDGEGSATLTNNIDIFQEYIAKYIDVLITPTLNTTQHVSFVGRTEPKVLFVNGKEVVTDRERYLRNASIFRVFPTSFVIVVFRAFNFIFDPGSVICCTNEQL